MARLAGSTLRQRLSWLVGLALCAAHAIALPPIQGYVQPAPEKTRVALTQSRIADQIELLPLSVGDERGTLGLDQYLAYRSRIDGATHATNSGEDAGAVLNPELPFKVVFIQGGSLGSCATSRLAPSGQAAWTRSVPTPDADPFDFGPWCQSLVEGQTSNWIRAGKHLVRLGRDGQILTTIQNPERLAAGIRAANVDSNSDTLLLVRRLQPESSWIITRAAPSGAVSEVPIAGAFERVLYPVLMRPSADAWRLLVLEPGRSAPTLLQWNADFSQQSNVRWNQALIREGFSTQVRDVRWLNADLALILLTDRSNSTARSAGYRLLTLSATGEVTTLAEATNQSVVHRLYPITAVQGITRHVLVSIENTPDQTRLSMSLFRDTTLVYRRELPIAAFHQISAIADSGEFLLAEKTGDHLTLSLLNETGQTLEQREVSLAPTPFRAFAGLAQDGGHYRAVVGLNPTSNRFQSILSKHNVSGSLLWTATIAGRIEYAIDDAMRVCVTPFMGDAQIVCLNTRDGAEPEQFNSTCEARQETLQLQSGQLSLGSCLVDPATSVTDQNQLALRLAPTRWRAANGEVLWSDGTAVRRLSANGSILNTFGSGDFASAHTPLKTPLRLLPDGSYVFARSETKAGIDGISIQRINAQGVVVWQHHEAGATFLPRGLITVGVRQEPLDVVGDHGHLRVYLPLADPTSPYELDREATLIVNLSDGGIASRVLDRWIRGIVLDQQLIEIGDTAINLLDSRGQRIGGYPYQIPRDNAALPPTADIAFATGPDARPVRNRVFNGRLQIEGLEYPLPSNVPVIRLDQDALDGAWATQLTLNDRPWLDGQGLVFEYLERDRLLFGAWFLYAPDASWRESDLRWFTLAGTIPNAASRVNLALFETRGGRFDQAPAVMARAVGTAELELDSCTTGILHYRFTQGEFAGQEGSLILARAEQETASCATVAEMPRPAAEITGFGFSSRQSGGYYEPGLDGQGVMLQIRPDLGPAGTAFGTWFSFDPAASANDPTAQHWLTLQGTLAPAQNGRITLQINRANGGRSLQSGQFWADYANDVHEAVVGMATLQFDGCARAKIEYRFDHTELAGSFAGLNGTMDLQKPYACP